MTESQNITKQQQRILTLIYKFRFITSPLLAKLLQIRQDSTYEALQKLVDVGLVIKVYKQQWRIDRRPAYYFLAPKGVTVIRKLLELNEKSVNPLYKDANAKDEFIRQCHLIMSCYIPLKHQYPDADIRTKTEINRFSMFPKNKPDLYMKLPDGKEAFISVLPDQLPYFVNKRRDEYIQHSEDEGWRNDQYPTVAFVLLNNSRKAGFLFNTKVKLENMGMGESDIIVMATSIESLLNSKTNTIWSSAASPLKAEKLL